MTETACLKTADFIILAAGVMGASIAFHLARRKAGRILVIDREHAGSGGSGRLFGPGSQHYSFFPPGSRTGPISLKFSTTGATLWRDRASFAGLDSWRIVHPGESELLKTERSPCKGVWGEGRN